MGPLELASKRGHEQITYFYYPDVGLKAIVAVHNTVLGPALGGCRMRLYESEEQALDDVLRLSEGMTYKSSLAGLDLGGGKSCIIADPHLQEGREDLFLKFGECLNYLHGRYITAEDMGTSVDDVMVMRKVTKWAAGYSREAGGSGDPSPWTALGVFKSIVAACERVFHTKDLAGRHIAIQGVGHVGMHLAELLHKSGAKLTVCDVESSRVQDAVNNFGAVAVGLDDIYDVECDVYAPCAMGQTVNKETIPRLKCKIIAGAANNVLIDSTVYPLIEEKQLLYCPDFLINAGGVISVAGEYIEGGWREDWVRNKVDNIYHTIHQVLDESEKRGKFPEVVAIELAKERIEREKSKKL